MGSNIYSRRSSKVEFNLNSIQSLIGGNIVLDRKVEREFLDESLRKWKYLIIFLKKHL